MKHINILIPASNIVAKRELYQYIMQNNLDIALHFPRLTFKTPYGENQEQYTRELVESIPAAMRQLERIKAEKTAVLCSSAALFYQGDEKFIFPLSCMVAELEQANITSPLVITPYNQAIGAQSIAELQKHHISLSKSIQRHVCNHDIDRALFLLCARGNVGHKRNPIWLLTKPDGIALETYICFYCERLFNECLSLIL